MATHEITGDKYTFDDIAREAACTWSFVSERGHFTKGDTVIMRETGDGGRVVRGLVDDVRPGASEYEWVNVRIHHWNM